MSSVNQTGKQYWRSLNELAETPEFQDWVQREFPHQAEKWLGDPGRRSFLRVMAASFALAGLTACRWPEEKIVPYSKRPEYMVPGEPVHFATSMEMSGIAAGLLVKSYDGRPVKIEGNDVHPGSRGAANIFAQASILEMYDPSRSQRIARRDERQTSYPEWPQFKEEAGNHFSQLRGQNGAGLCVLSEASNSPTLQDMRRRFEQAFPEARWFEYEPVSLDNEREASRLLFGQPHRMIPNFDQADVVLALDSDFLVNHPNAVEFAHQYNQRRDPDGEMNRLWSIEALYSPTGAMADHRLAVDADQIPHFTLCVMAEVLHNHWPSSSSVPAAFSDLKAQIEPYLEHNYPADFMAALANDLATHPKRSLILAGPRQPVELHTIALLFNAVLSNFGSTATFVEDSVPERAHHYQAIQQLAKAMQQGEVDTLVMLGGNPVVDAPADLGFANLLSNVNETYHLSLYENETSLASRWHVPRAHFLESWGDARAYDGTVSMVQPLIAPLYNGLSAIEMVALMNGESTNRGYNLVRRTHQSRWNPAQFETQWRKALHDGVIENTAQTAIIPSLSLAPIEETINRVGQMPAADESATPKLAFMADNKVFDGRFANNGWLQELPDFLSKLTWDNALLISPRAAEQLQVSQGEIVELQADGAQIELPVFVLPGMAHHTAYAALGYGRDSAGPVGDGVGTNLYPLRTSKAMDTRQVEIRATGRFHDLASTQDHFAIDETGKDERARRVKSLVQEGTQTLYKEDPEFAKAYGEHYPKHDLWTPPYDPDTEYKWGMSIDLNSCIGCNACVVACQAENNIPVVGKDEVKIGREMHWIRLDTYFKGEPDEAQVVHQPMACIHCENAPCEQVCPVAATVHDEEGLNVMVYNRCVGTRYCSNNCPVKVRRFNFFSYNYGMDDIEKMRMNPDVTVRMRGVMEKCTYCVQRINQVRYEAKNNERPIQDGEIKTACQQTCPTQAITFGDLNSSTSQITQKHADPRTYSILDILYIKPRTAYMARIRNYHPDLVEAHTQDDKHGHNSHS